MFMIDATPVCINFSGEDLLITNFYSCRLFLSYNLTFMVVKPVKKIKKPAMKYRSFLFSLLFFPFCNQPSTEDKIGNEVAVANGLDNFGKAEMVEFTFNVQRDTAAKSSRHWQWFPRANEVIFISDSATTRFRRSDTTTQELKQLNARFTNDEYWLLFPFHLKWDKGHQLFDSSMQVAPISGKSLRKITVKYNDKDGFTPGDRYDLFLDEALRIQEWSFHKGGVAKPSLSTTWENYADFNGLQLAQEHRSEDGKFRLWFSDIKIR